MAQRAPVNPPSGGFMIDGNLRANTPQPDSGDWAYGPGGNGDSVFTYLGALVHPTVTARIIRDLYNSNGDTVFTGSQFNENPNDQKWTISSASNKCDINNGMYLVTTSSTSKWIIMGGDRLATTGTSYIDFEFLQDTLTRNNSRGFTSQGPNGGRRVGDFVLSMQYSNGGTNATVHFYIWEAVSTGYKYVEHAIPTGDAFAQTNGVSVDAPFTAFGNNSYIPYSFVEAAVNADALLQSVNPCSHLSIKTLFIKTKASDATNAELKDFVEPQQVNFEFGSASIDYSDPFCATGTAAVTLTGNTGGKFSATPSGLSIDSTTGTIDLGASTAGTYSVTYTFNSGGGCSQPVSTSVTINPIPSVTPGTATLCSGGTSVLLPYSGATGLPTKYSIDFNATAEAQGFADVTDSTLRTAGIYIKVPSGAAAATYSGNLTVKNAGNCVSSSIAISVTVYANPSCLISGSSQQECSSDSTYSGPAGLTYQWSVSSGTATINGSTTNQSVSVRAPSGCSATFTLKLVVSNTNGCKDSCTKTISVADHTPPQITTCPSGITGQCTSSIPDIADGTVSMAIFQAQGGAATDNCGTPTVSKTDYTVSSGCRTYKNRVWRVTDGCGNYTECVQVINILDNTAPSITCPANVTLSSCSASTDPSVTGQANATDNCGSVTISHTDILTPSGCSSRPNITRIWTATDASGNVSSCTQQILAPAPSTVNFFYPDRIPGSTLIESQPANTGKTVPAIQVKAYPNPYSNMVNFSFVSPVSGKASLELYDLLGRKFGLIYQATVKAGEVYFTRYAIPSSKRTTLIYRLSVGEQVKYGKLLFSQQNR